MKQRKGMMVGQGSGFTNAIPVQDSQTHSNNAKGIKMPQQFSGRIAQLERQVQQYRQKIEDAKRVRAETAELAKLKIEAEKEVKALQKDVQKEKEQLKSVQTESEFVRKTKEFGAKALEKGKELGAEALVKGKELAIEAKEYAKEQYAEMKEKRAKEKIKELAEVNHPLVKKLQKQESRVNTLKSQVAESDDDSLIDELAEEEEQMRQIQEEATEIHVQDYNDQEPKTLAIRHQDNSFFGFSDNNPYKAELIRRIGVRKQLDRDIAQAEKKKPEESTFGGMFTGLIEW